MTIAAALGAENRRIVLFLAAGVVNTAFGYAAYVVALATGLAPPTAVVASTIAGVLFNYRTLRAVFAGSGFGRMPLFVCAYAILAGLNVGLLTLAQRFGLGPYVGELAALSVVTPLSYLAMRFVVFPRVPEIVT